MTRKKTKPHTKALSKKLQGQKKTPRKAAVEPKGIGMASTLRAAAAMTRLPLSVVNGAKAAGCQAFKSNGRIDCDLLITFISSMPPREDGLPDYDIERARLAEINRKLKQQEFDINAKELWPKAESRQSWFRNVIACKNKFYTAENAVAVEVGMRLNLTQDQITVIKETLGKHIRAAIKELHVGDWGVVECQECKKVIV